jgi:hypothetical protein
MSKLTDADKVIAAAAVSAQPAAGAVPVTPTNPNTGAQAPSVTPAYDKDMAKDFLASLDPNATRFTFQFFGDGADKFARIFHGTLDEVWPMVQAHNTPQRRSGVFVTINETDLAGRRAKNIVRARALFVDADSDEQARHCLDTFAACGAKPSMIVKSGRGMHFYLLCSDIPRDQFPALQKCLIEKLGTDAAVHDLPRVMRLPGTLHLKDPANPRLVKLYPASGPVRRWQLTELVAKMGLLPGEQAQDRSQNEAFSISLTAAQREHIQKLFGPLQSLAEGLETNIDEICSAASAIPPSAISTEGDWMKFARAFAHEARVFPHQKELLWEVLDTASRRAPGYDEADNRRRFERYISEALEHDNPITIATVFHMAEAHGWQGWSPPMTATASPSVVWTAADLKVSFVNIPHRQWLYGTYLVRGELTVVAAPGGAGKTALATGLAVELATGTELLGERIWGRNDLKVLFINAEDGGTEITRRVWAFCLAHAHKLAGQNLDRLHVAGADDGRVQRLSFLRTTDRNISMLDRSGFDVLLSALATLRPDVLILDPLVALCGGGNMNDNAVMSLVIRELKGLATKFNCAVLIVHHTRKGGDVGNAESISGAAATVNLARCALMPVPMSDEEAKKFGVLPSERFRYFKVVNAKSNLTPRSTDSPWYQLHSVELPNPEPPIYPHGDSVQAVTRVDLATPSSAAAAAGDKKMQRAIIDLINRGKIIDGKQYPYSPSIAGAENKRALLEDAKAAVAKAMGPQVWGPGDLEAVTKRAIAKMKREGVLVEKELKELTQGRGRFRKGRGLAVNRACTSLPDLSADGGAAATRAPETVQDQIPNNAAQDGGQLVNELPND